MRYPEKSTLIRRRPVWAFTLVIIWLVGFALFAIQPAYATPAETNQEPRNTQQPSLLAASNITTLDEDGQSDGIIASGANGTCVWSIDADGKLTIAPAEGDSGILNFDQLGYPSWKDHCSDVTSVVIEGNVSLTGNNCYMFWGCSNLETVNLSGLDTSKATSFDAMFQGCSKLTTLDLSSLDASSITHLNYMFCNCANLSELKLPDFSNARIDLMLNTFDACESLSTVDLSAVDTSTLRGIFNLFRGCSSLSKVIVGPKWDLSTSSCFNQNSIGFFQEVFTGCDSLVGANGTSFAEARIDDYSYARVDTFDTPGYFWPPENENAGGETANAQSDDDGEMIASGAIGTCVWSIDANGKLIIAPAEGGYGTLDFWDPEADNPDYPPWYEYSSRITSAKAKGLILLQGTKTARMFYSCNNLESVELSNLDISKATDISGMFKGCSKLTTLDLSALDASSVKTAGSMFDGCTNLAKVKLPDFSNAPIKFMLNMFTNCKSLQYVNLSSVDTSSLRGIGEMFMGCTSLSKVVVGPKWDLPPRVSAEQTGTILFQRVFSGCNSLVGANGTSFAEAQVNDYSYARVDAPDAPGYFWLPGEGNADEENWNEESEDEVETIVSDVVGTCVWSIDSNGKLTIAPAEGDSCILDFKNDRTINPNRPPWYYQYSLNIKSVELEGSISLEGKTSYMFGGCSNLERVDLSGLDVSKASELVGMFGSCSKLTSLDLSSLDVSSVRSTYGMFSGCTKLVDLKLPDFSNAPIELMLSMFSNCESLQTVDLSTIDTSSLRGMGEMFWGCSSLSKVVVGPKWDISSRIYASENAVVLFQQVFTGCDSLVGANGTSFAQAQVDDFSYARVDTPETPGYFWLSGSEDAGSGAGSSGGGGENPTGGEGAGNGSGGEGGGTEDPTGGEGTGDGENDPDNGDANNPAGTQPSDVSENTGLSPAKALTVRPVVTLSARTFEYSGKKRMPSVTVKLGGKKLVAKRDYTILKPKKRTAIGTYTVAVVGVGNYKFKVRKRFSIVPRAPKMKSLKAQRNSDGSSGFIAQWRKSSKGSIGYQISWSSSKKFKPNSRYTFKANTTFAKKGTAALQVKTRAWLGRTIYVKARAYKSVRGVKYYSHWSKPKTVKLKR